MKVYILTIGDELLLGQIVDTNSARMAHMLIPIGAKVVRKMAVSDNLEEISSGLNDAMQLADVILMTGGLGPTKDDITKKALANFFDTGFVYHQETWERIQKIFTSKGLPITEGVRNQCWMPQNAEILTNKSGTAPGMWFEEKGKIFVSMPGVPYEMEYLMEFEVIPKLIKHFNGTPSMHRTLLTSGEGESSIAERLKEFESSLPDNIKLAYLPGIGLVRLRLTVFGRNKKGVEETLNIYFQKMQDLIPLKLKAGVNEDSLQVVVGRILKEKGLTLTTAESCTGGYLSHLITSVPGSSEYFLGSVIAYNNDVKEHQLGVSKETLTNFGAVSEATVKEMVSGAIQLIGANIAIAVSGIAGPGGDTEEKPVGTVWIAVGNKNRCETMQVKIGRDRIRNIQYAAAYALNKLRLFLEYPE